MTQENPSPAQGPEGQAYLVLLYYHYAKIDDPEAFREAHHALCLRLNLLGRIVVAAEGLNGSVSGLRADCEAYMAEVKADPRFAETDFKAEPHEGHAFSKLHVRLKPEIVHSGLRHIDPTDRTGGYIEPEEFKEIMSDPEYVVVDVRSDYEHRLGRFKGAVTLDIGHFREFPEKAKELERYKGKKVVTYCTGGIKCEKASAFLLEQGFENVYQLHGGIIKYGLETDGEGFEGKCYVFDERIQTEVNRADPTIASRCYSCGQPTENMVNCANADCNRHTTLCPDCLDRLEGACSEECQCSPAKRPYDGTGAYRKDANHYDPRTAFETVAHQRALEREKREKAKG